jgi:hypothetical protein
MRTGIWVIVFMTGFLWSTASQAQDDDTILFDLGYVEDNIFYNDFFEFEFKIPGNWDYKLDTDQKIVKKALKKAFGESSELRYYLDPAEVQTAILVMITRKVTYGESYLTPNMIVMIENIGSTLIRTAPEYLASSARGMKMTNPDVKISKDEYLRFQFGGKTFFAMNTKTKVGSTKLNQMVCSTIIGDFAFSTVLTYMEKDQLPEMLQIMESFIFED